MGEMKAQLSWATLIGNVFKSVGGPITWASKRQRTVFISSTNAETKAIAKGVKESIWLCTLLGRMEGKHLLQQRKLNAGFLQMKHFAAAVTVCLLCIVCSVGIQHGDISPEHVMQFVVANGEYDYILTDWGHAVLEERYSPAISPEFSPTSALHEGRLCPASDAESLIYLLSFVSGCAIPEFDSMEAALRWRNRVWA
ncbi:unnamed protein product [Sphagnum troendelagicum]|uniref:Protein kinase domain-containing protein n=1 Tax=Sphagnum jensenii TaxID=128206 RepID=A0ABP0WSR4_9BRYO